MGKLGSERVVGKTPCETSTKIDSCVTVFSQKVITVKRRVRTFIFV